MHCTVYENRFRCLKCSILSCNCDKSRASSEEASQFHCLTTATSLQQFNNNNRTGCGERKKILLTHLLSNYLEMLFFIQRLFSFSWSCIFVLTAGKKHWQICDKFVKRKKRKAFPSFQGAKEASATLLLNII